MELNEIKNKINSLNYMGNVDYLCDEWYENEELKNVDFDYKENLDRDEERWFTIETNVYEISYKKESLGFLAIREVGTLKSEAMSIEDCYCPLKAYNVKKIIKESYEISEEG